MSNVKLRNCGFSTILGKASDDNSQLDVEVMVLKPGIYHDMNGTEVPVTAKTIHSLCDTYNETVKKQFESDMILTPKIAEDGLENFDNRNAPNQLDHDDGTVLKTVGHVIGLMHIKDINEEPHLFLKGRVKGVENVMPVKDKRRRNVSLQYNPKTFEFVEFSWVVKGAAPEARALLSKETEKSSNLLVKSSNLNNEAVILRQTEQELLKQKQALEQKLAVKKHLIALCVNRRINKATADFVEHTIESKKIDNPIEVVKLMESILPNEKFKPQYYKLAEKENGTMSEQATPIVTVHDLLATISLAKPKLSEDDKGDKEDKTELKKYSKEHALKHKEIMSKMAESYEKGDIEMGKKYLEKANKLSEDCADGTANLSEYDIEEDGSKADDVKKMSAELEKITIALAKNKEEQTIAFNKYKDEQMAVLSSFTEKLTENFNSSDVKVLLSKIAEIQGVKA